MDLLILIIIITMANNFCQEISVVWSDKKLRREFVCDPYSLQSMKVGSSTFFFLISMCLTMIAGRVNESQVAFTDTKNTMKICELKQEVANVRVAKLQSQLKSAIKASR